MKIAHLTTVDLSLRYLVMPQLVAIRELGAESIGISAPGPDVAALEAAGIRHLALPSSTRGVSVGADLRAAWQLWKILRRERISILHTHNPKPGIYGRVLGRLAGVPVVVNTIHGLYATEDDPALKRMVVYGLEALAARFSDHELAQNPEDIDTLGRLLPYPHHKLSLLGNGVDLSRFDPAAASKARTQMREELGIQEDEVAVGMVGRLVAEKGYPEYFEAARMLAGRSFVFLAIGPDDPTKPDALDRRVVDQARQSGVQFLGMRTDVDRLYGALDIFVLPSHREGFPRAAMEAAACGLPIVATNVRGCRQVVDDGRSGLLIPVGDTPALAAALMQLADNQGLRRAMGHAAYLKAQVEFDERLVVSKVLDVYRRHAPRKGLSWPPATREVIRRAAPQERVPIAHLHRNEINTGFLSSLGSGFLTVLYGVMIDDPNSAVIVAARERDILGFVAGTADTASFYRRFARRGAIAAGLRALPYLRPGTIRRIRETRNYGHEDRAVPAELLAMAVAPAVRGQGLAHRLGGELLHWAAERGLPSMKVVVGSGNQSAIKVYRRLGFEDAHEVEVHEGETSLELVWIH